MNENMSFKYILYLFWSDGLNAL